MLVRKLPCSVILNMLNKEQVHNAGVRGTYNLIGEGFLGGCGVFFSAIFCRVQLY